MRPPSQLFQLPVIVTITATAKMMTINGVPYFCHAGFRREGGGSTTLGAEGDGMIAGAGEVAICIQVLLESLVLSRFYCCLKGIVAATHRFKHVPGRFQACLLICL